MHTAPIDKSQNNIFDHRPLRERTSNNSQDGAPEPAFLLAMPDEALLHISLLDQVNRQLHNLVSTEHCWMRAFLLFFLSIGPEAITNPQIRRIKPTWREEYIARFKLVKRWQRSRAASVTHLPQWAPISSMHLMVDGAALLSASLIHGVVARSNAITGKRLKAFVNSFGALVQRPTGDHAIPSTMALASDGGTGKVAWGFFGGTVALTRMPHVMDMGAPRTISCGLADAHAAPISYLEFSAGGHVLASASSDGSLRLWDTRRMRCLWSHTPVDGAEACTKIVLNLPAGILIGALQTGTIVVWSGFEIDAVGDTYSVENVRSRSIVAPPPPESVAIQSVAYVALDASDQTLAVLYNGHRSFFKVDAESTASPEDSHGLITCMRASFASQLKTTLAEPGPKHVITGNKAGWLLVWDWQSLTCTKAWQAHDDGAVTALELSENLFASGSATGSITVWDSLTFEPLRTFATPVPRAVANQPASEEKEVTQLVVSDTHIIGCVANRVIAWRVQQRVGYDLAGKRNLKGGTARHMSPKWQDQLEMRKAIHDSHEVLLDDYDYSQRRAAFGGRMREQRSALDNLGLEEIEALEYVLMLSRDEEEARQRSRVISGSVESTSSLASQPGSGGGSSAWSASGIEFDEQSAGSNGSPPTHASEYEGEPEMFPLTPIPSPPRSPPFGPTAPATVWPYTMPAPDSNHKVQVSPPFRPEPTTAGSSPAPVPLLSEVVPSIAMDAHRLPAISAEEFPAMPSPTPGSSPSARRSSTSSGASRVPSASPSPPRTPLLAPKKSWSAVARQNVQINKDPALPTTSFAQPKAWGPARPSWQPPKPQAASIPVWSAPSKSEHHAMTPQTMDEENEMLRLALEASMADP
ncbi:WD40 repeat-like protein [Auriculariales sp. MPI-PUGE-AT-0066]|nr:WD40 repeat-like protein [Auriculariales sp. MPI-PUGE-AT-0066]